MTVYRHEISHRWERRMLLREYRAGKIPRENICDADFLLVAAATHHGYPADRDCPVCGNDSLREVRWIYGDQLGRRSGTARSDEEIAEIVDKIPDVTVHLVEVCPRCKWNHLLTRAVADAA